MNSMHIRNPKNRYYTILQDKWFKCKIIKMATRIHFGFMQIKQIVISATRNAVASSGVSSDELFFEECYVISAPADRQTGLMANNSGPRSDRY